MTMLFRRFSLIISVLLLVSCLHGCSDDSKSEKSPSGMSVADLSRFRELIETTDLVRGKQLYEACISCHAIDVGGVSPAGPNLHGVAGRAIAGLADYPYYSPTLRNANGHWTVDALDAFLAYPQESYPGNTMAYSDIKNAGDRAALIAYMASHSIPKL